MAASRPKPLSTHTTNRSSASGRDKKIASCRLRRSHHKMMLGSQKPKQVKYTGHWRVEKLSLRPGTNIQTDAKKNAIKQTKRTPEYTMVAPSLRKPALASLVLSA